MDPFLGEIRIFGGSFAPKGWALCNGQLLPIAQNTALFSLLATNFGGDGRSTFGLPDFQGRAPMHWGNGTGLSPRSLGEKAGTPTVTLNVSQLPAHNHTLNGVGGRASAGASSPANAAFAPADIYVNPPASPVTMSQSGTGLTGGGQPHNNMQSYQALSFIIALQGIYPQRP